MANSQSSNPWFPISMGLIGLIVGYGLASGLTGLPIRVPGTQPAADGGQVPSPDQQVPPAPTNETPPTVDDDAVLGKEDAPITVIEFTDFQCPFCSRHYQQTFLSIKKDYIDTGKVKYVVRDFPLGFHSNANKAAQAAECAHDQGKFWEMHDQLFGKQSEWSDQPNAVDTFKKYAGELKLNTADFASCIDGDKFAQEISKDQSDGSTSGIDGTPGFWILGPGGKNQKISGAYPYDTFKKAFDALLGS